MRCRWLASNVGKVERALIMTRGAPRHQATNIDGDDDEGIGKSRDRDRSGKLLGCSTLLIAERPFHNFHCETVRPYTTPLLDFTGATPPFTGISRNIMQ